MLLALALGGLRSCLYEQHTLLLIVSADVYAMLCCSMYMLSSMLYVCSTTPVYTYTCRSLHL